MAEKQRESAFELLRITAMLMVLVLHVDFVSLKAPMAADFVSDPLFAWSRLIPEEMSVCAVDLFVLISGWFGMRLSFRKAGALYGELVFFLFSGLLMASAGAGRWMWNTTTVLNGLLNPGVYWFVKAYLILCVTAPLLNDFIGRSDGRTLWRIIGAFVLMQAVFGWYYEGFLFRGYSPVNFLLLYLLGRAIRLHSRPVAHISGGNWVVAFIFITALQCGFYVWLVAPGKVPNAVLNAYSSPLVIAQAACVLLAFSHMRFKSGVVNYVATGAFAAYLLHCNPFLFKRWYIDVVRGFHAQYPGIAGVLMIAGYVLLVYLAGLLLESSRRWVLAAFARRWGLKS